MSGFPRPAIASPSRSLAPREVRRAMRLAVLEGIAYALMVGLGETYFLADAIRLGAVPLEQGLVVTLPLLVGSLGPLFALRLLARTRARRPLVAGAVGAQVAVLGALAGLDLAGASRPATLIAGACLYHVCGMAAGTAWSSWYGDLVPGRIRGRYFARRTRAVQLSTGVALAGGGLLLQALEPSIPGTAAGAGGGGFALLFGLAALFRLVSAVLLLRSPEPRFRGLPGRARVVRFLRAERGRRALRVLGLVASLQLFVCVAAPYFSGYMLVELGFAYSEYMFASVWILGVKALLLPLWGRAVDRRGARAPLALAALLLAVVPLPWLWAQGLGVVLAAQSLSGLAWAGFELSFFALLLESSDRGIRPQLFAAQSAVSGAAQLLGSLLGALVVSLAGGDVRAAFALSLIGRLLVGGSLALFLPHPGAPRVRRRDLVLRVAGYRPNGGLVHRPLPPPPERSEA